MQFELLSFARSETGGLLTLGIMICLLLWIEIVEGKQTVLASDMLLYKGKKQRTPAICSY